MFRRTASILTIRSATVLHSRCSRRCFPPYSVTRRYSLQGDVVDGAKTVSFDKDLSTTSRRNIGLHLGRTNQRHFDGNPGGVGDQQKSAEDLARAPGDDFRVRKSDEFYQGETLDGFYAEKAAGSRQIPMRYERGSYGSPNWNQDGHPHSESTRVPHEVATGFGFIQTAVGSGRDLKGESQQTSQVFGHQLGNHQRQNGYHAEDRPEFHPSTVGHYGSSGQKQNLDHGAHTRQVLQQHPQAFQKSLEYQQRPNGLDAEKRTENFPDRYSASLGTKQTVENKTIGGDFQQVRGTVYNPVEFRQNCSSPYEDKPHEFHSMPSGYSAATNVIGNSGGDLQQSQLSYNHIGYQNETDGYFGRPSEFQNNTSEFYRENGTQPSLSFVGDGTEYSKPLIENADNAGYRGTLDELDVLCKERRLDDALKVLELLEKLGTVVDLPRYFQLFQLCGDAKSLEAARKIHEHVVRVMGKVEINVCNRILKMYCRCGSMEDARELFEKMPVRNLTSWDTMIMGFANNGLGEDAIDLFTQFKQKGLIPDPCIFLTVFHACGVLGAVNEGMLHLESMSKEYGIVPNMEHYVGIVDMLGEAGHLEEALEYIEKMPHKPSVGAWEALMIHCRVHGNVDLGDRCAEIIESIDSSRLTKESRSGLVPVKAPDPVKKEKKKPNPLEGRKMQEYRAGDRSHPERDRIYEQIYRMASHMREAGYVPETRFVLHDVDQETKEEALLYHSEKLATAFSLISTPARSQIRIIKNLRICVDCHNALKLVSKLSGRRFIIRDVKRFHHMEDGVCTCNDYW